jgi:hypothetical protein
VDNIVYAVVDLLKNTSLTCKVAEISARRVYYRDHHEFCAEQMAAVIGAAGELQAWNGTA